MALFGRRLIVGYERGWFRVLQTERILPPGGGPPESVTERGHWRGFGMLYAGVRF